MPDSNRTLLTPVDAVGVYVVFHKTAWLLVIKINLRNLICWIFLASVIRLLIVFQSFIQEESKEAQLFDSAVQRYQLRETGRFIQVKDEITGL